MLLRSLLVIFASNFPPKSRDLGFRMQPKVLRNKALGTNPVRKVTAGCLRDATGKLASSRHTKPCSTCWRIRSFSSFRVGGWDKKM
jgi:hypothetical protein